MSTRRGELVLACCLSLACAACGGYSRWPWGTTQRLPEPMEPLVDPLPPGDLNLIAPGPEEVLVLRHADPVQVRPAGLASSFPLSFSKKSLRVHSGSAVYSAPGGRCEVLWPSGTSIVLFGRGSGLIGSRSRGESLFVLRQLERAQIEFKLEDQVELLGGAHLIGKSGPFILDHIRDDIVRIKNQSKLTGRVAYREEVFELDPGQAVDLALLSVGSHPVQSDPRLTSVQGPGFAVKYSGTVEVENRADSVALRGEGEHEIQALGVSVRMDRAEKVEFRGLAPAPAAESEPAPAPATPK